MSIFGALARLVTRQDYFPPKFLVQNLDIVRGEVSHNEAAVTIEVVTPPKNGHVLTRWLEQINTGLRVAFGHPNSDFIITQGSHHTIVLPLQDLLRHIDLESLGINSNNARCEFVSNRGRCEINFYLKGTDGQPVEQSLTRHAASLIQQSLFFQHAGVVGGQEGKISICSFDILKIVNSFIKIDQERYRGDFTNHLEKLCLGNFTEAAPLKQNRRDLIFAHREGVHTCHRVRDRLLSIAELAKKFCVAKRPSSFHALTTPVSPPIVPDLLATKSSLPRSYGSPFVDLSTLPAPRRDSSHPRSSDGEQCASPQKRGWLRRLGSSVFGVANSPQVLNAMPKHREIERVGGKENVLEAELAVHELHTEVADKIMSVVDFGLRLVLFPVLTVKGIHPRPNLD